MQTFVSVIHTVSIFALAIGITCVIIVQREQRHVIDSLLTFFHELKGLQTKTSRTDMPDRTGSKKIPSGNLSTNSESSGA